MSCVLTDSPTTQNSETLKLVHLLNNLESELEQPYIERRLKQVAHKSNLLEELQDAVQELTQREKDLQASIGISKMLIENNNTLMQENNDLKQEILNLKSSNKQLNGDIQRCKEKLEITEEKYHEANRNLIKTESEFIQIAAEVKRNLDRGFESEESPRKISVDRYESDLNELSIKFKQEHDYLLSSKLEAEKKSKALENSLNETNETCFKLEKTCDDLSKKLRKLEKNLKKTEEKYSTELQQREETEIMYDELFEKHKKLLQITEKQAEELEISKLPSHAPSHSAQFEEIDSLKAELEEIAQDDDYQELLFRKSFSFPNFRNSFKANPRTMGIHKQDLISIKQRQSRKSPCEEYFFLSTQAIKLNSPYMDTICTISPTTLYSTAIKNDVPFHKWHLWIENQLNSAYLSKIYQKS